MTDPNDEVRSLLLEHNDDPDFVYDPDNWEVTYPWVDRAEMVDGMGLWYKDIKRLETLVRGPDKWVVDVVLTWDDDGDPDETELQWFDSKEEAEKALAESLEKRPLEPT